MAEFTYHDYLLHKVVQPYSLRGQNTESNSLKKNIPLYLTRQAGKVREKFGNLDSKELITKQAVQLPQQMHDVQEQLEEPQIKQRGIDTNNGMKREDRMYEGDGFDGKDDPIIRQIKSKIAMEKFDDDFFVLTEGARQSNIKKEEKLSVEKQIKTVLQEKVNEDQLKKLYRKYILETMKKNIEIDKKSAAKKLSDSKVCSLQVIERKKTGIQQISSSQKIPIGGETFLNKPKLKKEETLSEFYQIEEMEENSFFKKESRLVDESPSKIESSQITSSKINSTYKITSKNGSQVRVPSKVQRSSAESSEDDEDGGGMTQRMNNDSKNGLARLREINKKQQQYKVNNKFSDKEDKSRGVIIQKKLTDISLDSEKSQHNNDLFNSSFDDNEDLESSTSSFRRPKKLKQETNENEEKEEQAQSDQILTLEPIERKSKQLLEQKNDLLNNKITKHPIQLMREKEEGIFYDRIKHENEENLVNEQDEQIIRKVINLENQQQLYSKFIVKKKKEMQITHLMDLKNSKTAKSKPQSPIKQQYVQQRQNSNSATATPSLKSSRIKLTHRLSILSGQQPVGIGGIQGIQNIQQGGNAFFSSVQSQQFSMANSVNASHLSSIMESTTQQKNMISGPFLTRNPSRLSLNGLQKNNLQSKKQQLLSITQKFPLSTTNAQQTSSIFQNPKDSQITKAVNSKILNTNESINNSKSQFDNSIIHQPQQDQNFAKKLIKSYKLQDGKPVHEHSILSFLKNDFKFQELPQKSFQKINTQSSSQSDANPSRILTKSRLDYLSAPKYSAIDFDTHSHSQKGSRKWLNQSQMSSQQQPKINFYTARKVNKIELDKMKGEFLKFVDSCFERKHDFDDQKQKLRQEISDWYCSSQHDLNKLFNNNGPQMSTLSPEFKAFIEQKNFQKKLFNFLINSMEPKDRQMAIYLYKQERQLDDL